MVIWLTVCCSRTRTASSQWHSGVLWNNWFITLWLLLNMPLFVVFFWISWNEKWYKTLIKTIDELSQAKNVHGFNNLLFVSTLSSLQRWRRFRKIHFISMNELETWVCCFSYIESFEVDYWAYTVWWHLHKDNITECNLIHLISCSRQWGN